MFNLGMMEILVVLMVAFLVVGPKDLPRVARWIARQIKSLKKLIREIKKETGWDEFAKEFRDTADDLKATVKEADVSGDVKAAADDLRGTVDSVRKEIDEAAEAFNQDINR
ncbi:MAG: twin-arginine translocase TatA/TatE family subunit [Clostridia bacterium]|nr:twin-arginine translocase TatA/TatE family subunit [Clostridia bacterium]